MRQPFWHLQGVVAAQTLSPIRVNRFGKRTLPGVAGKNWHRNETPLRANNGLMQRNKQHPYSITSSARPRPAISPTGDMERFVRDQITAV
jgi:hypothetical protein